jgi:4-alpha-glucanotransferase
VSQSDPLHRLADRAGVLTVYTDLHGHPAPASGPAVHAALVALGVLVPGQDPATALEEPLPPAPARVVWRGEDEADGPEPGWYDVEGADGPERLIVAPVRAWRPEASRRSFGVFLPHHALHDAHTRGLGDYSALGRLGAFAAARGARVLGTLPLLPTFLGPTGPYEPSPYAPVSRCFFAEHLVDPTADPAFRDCGPARERLERARSDGTLARLRESTHVDPAGAWRLQAELLEHLSRHHWTDPHRRAALVAWADARPMRWAYAWFRAQTLRRGPWPTWTEDLRDRRSLPPGTFRPYGPDDPLIFWLHAQHEAERQVLALRDALASEGVELYLDLPIGTHPDGFDTWWDRAAFVEGASAGAPPDPYFQSGQDWGFPPLHPHRWRPTGDDAFLAAIEAHTRAAHRLRLDHVMGLYRLYWVPRGLGAREGLYVRYPDEVMWAALCLASHQHRCALVGENLGMVPPQVTEALRRHGIQGMAVGQFAIQPDRRAPLRRPEAGVLACLNTHDTPTFAGWWEAEDLRAHVELGWMDPDRATHERLWRARQAGAIAGHAERGPLRWPAAPLPQAVAAGVYRELCESDAEVVLVNLEDLWGETRPHNVPGTWRERPNWLRRAARPLEAFSDPALEATLAHLREARPR